MAFTLSAATTIQGIANSRYVTGTGNLSDLVTALSAIPAPFSIAWSGNRLLMTGSGTSIVIAICGSLVEQRIGAYHVEVSNGAHVCWGSDVSNLTTTLSAAAASGANTVAVASAANIIVGSYLSFAGVTSGGKGGSQYFRVTAVSGTIVTIGTALPSALASGAVVTIAGSSVLGLFTGNKTLSQVDVIYGSNALAVGWGNISTLAQANPNFCLVGKGVGEFNCGSFIYSHTARADYDFYYQSYVYSDRWTHSMSSFGQQYPHTHYGKLDTTSNTIFLKPAGAGGGYGLETGGATPQTNVSPFACNDLLGFRYTANLTLANFTVNKPNYYLIDAYAPNAGSYGKVIDSAYLYFAPLAFPSNAQVPVYEIFRSLNVSWKKTDGSAIASSSTPAKLVLIGGSAPVAGGTQNIVMNPLVVPFTTDSITQLIRQSSKAANAGYTFDGVQTQTGFTDDAVLDVYLVSLGYAKKFASVSAKPAYGSVSTDGISLSAQSQISPAYTGGDGSAIVTSPFAFSTTGAGTLSIASAATVQQASDYLFKHAYDNASSTYWRGLLHSPVALNSGVLDFGSIAIAAYAPVTGSIKTLGVVTMEAAWASGGSITANVTQSTPVDMTGVTITGHLTYNTDVAKTVTLTNCTITGTVSNAGTGAIRVLLVNSTLGSAGTNVSQLRKKTITKSDGASFNIYARYGTTGAYTNIGYAADSTSVTYEVPVGQPLEIVAWSLGCVTYSRTISASDASATFSMEMVTNASINTALDVSSYLANISLSLDTSGATPFFVITFNAAMTISGIELGKALVHKLVGQEIALRSGFPPGSTSTIVINTDEITNQLPAVRLDVGAAVPVTGRVYLDFFINTSAAQAVNSAYVINPPRADGNQVQILRAKPALDASQLSASVWSASQRTLTSASTARPSIDF